MLETGAFRNRPADYLMFLTFGCVCFLFASYFLGLEFMADGFSFMTLYLWCRKNPNLEINFLDVFVFRSCFLAYFYLVLTVLCGFMSTNQIVGCLVGHLYYFLEDVVPRLEDTKGIKVIYTP
jgi:Derlin-2/3